MIYKFFAFATAFMCMCTSAYSAEPYIGGSLSTLYYDEPDVLEEATGFLGGRLTLGVDLNEYFGLEAHGGVSPHRKKLEGYDLKFQIQQWGGVYAKIGGPVSDNADLYALLGYSRVTLKLTGAVVESFSETDPSYGLGLKLRISDTTSAVFDAVMLYHDSFVTIADISAGVQWRFGASTSPAATTAPSVEPPPAQEPQSSLQAIPPSPTPQAATIQSRPNATTSTTTILRATPRSTARALFSIPAGGAVEVKSRMTNTEGPWAFVRFEGREGWIAGDSLGR